MVYYKSFICFSLFYIGFNTYIIINNQKKLIKINKNIEKKLLESNDLAKKDVFNMEKLLECKDLVQLDSSLQDILKNIDLLKEKTKESYFFV